MVDDEPIGVFREEEAVAELHLRARFASDHHMDVRFLKAQDLFRIGHQPPGNDPLMRLAARLGQLSKDRVDPSENHLSTLARKVRGVPLLRECLAVALRVGFDHLRKRLDLAQHLLAFLV